MLTMLKYFESFFNVKIFSKHLLEFVKINRDKMHKNYNTLFIKQFRFPKGKY